MERMTSTVEEIREAEKETKIKELKNWVKDHEEEIIAFGLTVNFEDVTSINDIQKTISNFAEAIDNNAILKVTNCVLKLEFAKINKRD